MSNQKRTTTVPALPEFSLVSKLVPQFYRVPLARWVNVPQSRMDAAIGLDRIARSIPKDALVRDGEMSCRSSLQWVAMEIAAGFSIFQESYQQVSFEKYARGDMAPKSFYARIAMVLVPGSSDEQGK